MDQQPQHEVITLIEEPWRDRLARIRRGLRAPRNSGEWRYARFALMRILGPPTISIALTLLIVLTLLTLVAARGLMEERAVDVTVMDVRTVDLDKIKEEIERIEEPLEPPPDVENVSLPQDMPVMDTVAAGPTMETDLQSVTPQVTRSPLVLRDLVGSRSDAGRREGLRAFGAPAGTEEAVLRALRWLKSVQKPDGSWAGQDETAMTGLALLAFLGHNETPASKEFGATVEKAIKYLIEVQNADGYFGKETGGHLPYIHGIATYAISEAFALTKIMAVRDAMEKGVEALIKGQQDCGAFDYAYKKADRSDLSVAGWQLQALKAAQFAGSSNEKIHKAIENGIRYLRRQAFAANGSGFVYSTKPNEQAASGGTWTMTSVGVLCLQLLGQGGSPEVRTGLKVLEDIECKWPADEKSKAAVYGWYYLTQAKFQRGESTWNAWNRQFAPTLIRAQSKEGYWAGGDHDQGSHVYTTTLCVLMLEVYYRYLPTFKRVEDAPVVEATSKDDVIVDVR